METVKARSDTKPKREMKVLALGLPRSGSASICEALTVLGYKDVYHGLKALDSKEDWAIMDRAADASFPVLPTYTGKPFTRDQWDELFGHCEGACDVAAVFAPQLIDAYPDAKVILVIRDYDKWFKSVDEGVIHGLWGPMAKFSISVIEPILGSVAGQAARKQVLGLFEAHSADECRTKAREAYDRHHRVIREMVPPQQLLEYRMGEGWEPICAFLDKPVPDVGFPRVNEAAALRKIIMSKVTKNTLEATKILMPWVGGTFLVGATSWMIAKKLCL